jgi:oligopeptide/dipeptide ABC transporter ATP-binding protein
VTSASARPQPLRIEGLRVEIAGLRVLDGVSLAVGRGEVLGLVGESGCGKSMTGLAVMRLLPTAAQVSGGRITVSGTDILCLTEAGMRARRGRDVAMIFQDPAASLDPVWTIGGYLAETLRVACGMSGSGARAEAIRLLDRVGVPAAARRFADYPHQLSGGMNQRVMIANALAAKPSLLIADEPTTALDVTTQAQILDLLRELLRETGMGLLLITHDFGVIAEMADRVAVMYCGRVVESATVAAIFATPRHRYTRGLIGSLPPVDRVARLTAIPGTVPPLHALPRGCHFAPRCDARAARCESETPLLRRLAAEVEAACHDPVPA